MTTGTAEQHFIFLNEISVRCSRMFIKICGIKSIEDLKIVEKYGNATGVIVKSVSKRNISLERAREIITNSNIPVYAVSTVNTFKEWEEIITKTDTEYIQIHTDKIELNDIEKIKEIYNPKIIKAFKVPASCENVNEEYKKLLNRISTYRNIVDYILLDTGKGTGKTHDLRISKKISEVMDIIIAGGLKSENVNNIIDYVRPYGVDVSSGVEKNDKKDEELIKSFVYSIKNKN